MHTLRTIHAPPMHPQALCTPHALLRHPPCVPHAHLFDEHALLCLLKAAALVTKELVITVQHLHRAATRAAVFLFHKTEVRLTNRPRTNLKNAHFDCFIRFACQCMLSKYLSHGVHICTAPSSLPQQSSMLYLSADTAQGFKACAARQRMFFFYRSTVGWRLPWLRLDVGPQAGLIQGVYRVAGALGLHFVTLYRPLNILCMRADLKLRRQLVRLLFCSISRLKSMNTSSRHVTAQQCQFRGNER